MVHSRLIHENAQLMQGICTPLFRSADLNYFDYVRLYDDGSFFALASDSAWTEHFLARQFPIVSNALKPGTYLWNSGIECAYFAQDARDYYNHDHGITIIQRFSDHYESFSFAAPHTNAQAVNFYLNHMDQLKKFVWYFKERTAHLAQTNDKKLKRLPAPNFSITKTFENNQPIDAALFDKLKIKNYILDEAKLTQREMDCYLSLLNGKTAKETAKVLGLSAKTVEGYIEAIKQKLSCNNRSQLFEYAVSLGLISVL